MPQDMQNFVLHDNLANTTVVSGRRCFQFLGKTVCKSALKKLLGIGSSRFRRLSKGAPDMRRVPGHGKTHARQQSFAFSYLWGVYMTIAEFGPMSDAPSAVGLSAAAKADLEQAISTFCADRPTEADNIKRSMMLPGSLRKKYLPPGCKKEYYWIYIAEHTREHGTDNDDFAVKPASYTVFKQVWKTYFDQLLGFSKFSKHAQCNVCSELKAKMRCAKDAMEKSRWTSVYMDHQDGQMSDRHVYYRMRALSRQGQIICIMQDGSDQERYRVVRATRMPKAMQQLNQPTPKLKLLGCLAHGFVGAFYLIEEDVTKGSALTLEALFTTIEEARLARGGLPQHLWFQSDNAPGENKNQHVFAALAALVARKVFISCTAAFLRAY